MVVANLNPEARTYIRWNLKLCWLEKILWRIANVEAGVVHDELESNNCSIHYLTDLSFN